MCLFVYGVKFVSLVSSFSRVVRWSGHTLRHVFVGFGLELHTPLRGIVAEAYSRDVNQAVVLESGGFLDDSVFGLIEKLGEPPDFDQCAVIGAEFAQVNEHGGAVAGESDGFACEVGGVGPAEKSSGQHPEGDEQVGPAVHARCEGDGEVYQGIYRDEGEEGPGAECAAGGGDFVDDQAGVSYPAEFGNRQISTIAARRTAPVSHQFPMITQAPSIPAKMAMAAIDRLSLITLT